jgi:hypothetical protein
VIPPTCYETRERRAGTLMKAADKGFEQFIEKRSGKGPRALGSEVSARVTLASLGCWEQGCSEASLWYRPEGGSA